MLRICHGVIENFPQVLCDKWNFMKEDERKKFEKKKDYRNVEEQKKDTFGVKGKFKSGEIDVTTEVYMKNEVSTKILSFEYQIVSPTLIWNIFYFVLL